MKRFTIVLVAIAGLVLAGSALAKTSAKPGVYDPGHIGTVSAKWKTNAGVPDNRGTQEGLVLEKGGSTSDNAAAGANLKNVKGITLNGLGFNYKDGSACSGGAPRFNVQLTNGDFFFVACSYGDTTTSFPGWTHVSFTNDDFVAAGAYTWPGFGDAEVQSIGVIQDEAGKTTLDNIRVNNRTIHGS